MKQVTMPILLWVLVKTKHWVMYCVTIIATGFDIEQQNGIVNTEPKKIIHTLEG
jgi:hypothetical protein